MTEMNTLKVSNNSISGTLPQQRGTAALPKLQQLDLSFNKVRDASMPHAVIYAGCMLSVLTSTRPRLLFSVALIQK